jgi:hypothetical protein
MSICAKYMFASADNYTEHAQAYPKFQILVPSNKIQILSRKSKTKMVF